MKKWITVFVSEEDKVGFLALDVEFVLCSFDAEAEKAVELVLPEEEFVADHVLNSFNPLPLLPNTAQPNNIKVQRLIINIHNIIMVR